MNEKYNPERTCCSVCDARKVCHVCGAQTLWACSDCRIDLGATVYVCQKLVCQMTHAEKCPAETRATIRNHEAAIMDLKSRLQLALGVEIRGWLGNDELVGLVAELSKQTK